MSIALEFQLSKPSFRCTIQNESEEWLIECAAKIQQPSPLLHSFDIVCGRERLNGYKLEGRAFITDHPLVSNFGSNAIAGENKTPSYINLDYCRSSAAGDYREDEERWKSAAGYEICSQVSSELLRYLRGLDWERHNVVLIALTSEVETPGEGLARQGANYEWRHDGQETSKAHLMFLQIVIRPSAKM